MATAFHVACLLITISCVSTCSAQQIRHAASVEYVKSSVQNNHRRTDPQLVIYTRQLTPNVLRLARVVEQVASRHAALRCSLIVTHENDPTPPQQEWDHQFAQVTRVVEQYEEELPHVAFALWRRFPPDAGPMRAFRRYGRFGDGDVAIEFIRKRSRSEFRVITQYLEVLESDRLDTDALNSIAQQLARVAANPSTIAVPAPKEHP